MIRYTKDESKGGYTVFPEGTYDIEILAVSETRSGNGNPQLEVKGEVVDGPYASKTMKLWLSLLPQAAWKLEELFDALDIEKVDTGEEDEEGNTIWAYDEETLKGRVVMMEAEQRTHNNKVRNDWKAVGVSQFDAAGSDEESDDDSDESDDEAGDTPKAKSKSSSKPAKGNKGTRTRPRRRSR